MLHASKAVRCCGTLLQIRGMAGGGAAPGTYESVAVTREIEYKRRKRIRALIEDEKRYVASLPGNLY